MKKFSIEYHETYGRTYEIEANSPEEKEADPNSWRSQPKNWFFVGSRIRTECE